MNKFDTMEHGQLVTYKDKILQFTKSKLVTGFFQPKAEKIEQDDLRFSLNVPKIPLNIFRQFVQWARWTTKEHDSEGMAFLFYDEKNPEDPWSIWFPPQEGVGLKVKTLENHQQYREQRRRYKGIMCGTIHHHCKMGAGQSRTDSDDEFDFTGIHITLGNMDRDTYTQDTRIVLANRGQINTHLHHVVQVPEDLEETVQKYQLDDSILEQFLLKHREDDDEWDLLPKDNFHTRTMGFGFNESKKNHHSPGYHSKKKQLDEVTEFALTPNNFVYEVTDTGSLEKAKYLHSIKNDIFYNSNFLAFVDSTRNKTLESWYNFVIACAEEINSTPLHTYSDLSVILWEMPEREEYINNPSSMNKLRMMLREYMSS